MRKLNWLLMAALVLLPLAACDEGDGVVEVITGTISGTVTIDNAGRSGVTVTLAGAASATATTGSNGSYSFANQPAGAYTVTISNFPTDVTFQATSQAAVISTQGQTVTLNFSGQTVRTASISGRVGAGGQPVVGVTVTLSGAGTGTQATNTQGVYVFTGLRAGSYTIAISGFDANKYTFTQTSKTQTLTAGQAAIVDFSGSLKETGTLTATVTVDGKGTQGVTVAISGPKSESKTTGADGKATFTALVPGTYGVTISGTPANVSFDKTTASVTIADVGGSASVTFTGTSTKAGTIVGRLYIDQNGNDAYDATIPEKNYQKSGVWIVAEGPVVGQKDSVQTSASGEYSFASRAAGSYSVQNRNNATSTKLKLGTSAAPTVTLATGTAGGTANFGYDIDSVSVSVTAVGGFERNEGSGVKDVEIKLFGDENKTKQLGTTQKTGSTGEAKFTFKLSDDTSPTGSSDGVVFSSVVLGTVPAGRAVVQDSSMTITLTAGDTITTVSDKVNVIYNDFKLVVRAMNAKGDSLKDWELTVRRAAADTAVAKNDEERDLSAAGQTLYGKATALKTAASGYAVQASLLGTTGLAVPTLSAGTLASETDTIWMRLENSQDGLTPALTDPTDFKAVGVPSAKATASTRYLRLIWDGSTDSINVGSIETTYKRVQISGALFHEQNDTAGKGSSDDTDEVGAFSVKLRKVQAGDSKAVDVSTDIPAAAGTFGFAHTTSLYVDSTYQVLLLRTDKDHKFLGDTLITVKPDGKSFVVTPTGSPFAYKFTNHTVEANVYNEQGSATGAFNGCNNDPCVNKVIVQMRPLLALGDTFGTRTDTTALTDAVNGTYKFTGVHEGKYEVSIVGTQTTDGAVKFKSIDSPDTIDVQTAARATSVAGGVAFGGAAPGPDLEIVQTDRVIGGYIYDDTDVDAVADTLEGLGGVSVKLIGDLDGDGAVDDTVSVTSDAIGKFEFTNLREGSGLKVDAGNGTNFNTEPSSVSNLAVHETANLPATRNNASGTNFEARYTNTSIVVDVKTAVGDTAKANVSLSLYKCTTAGSVEGSEDDGAVGDDGDQAGGGDCAGATFSVGGATNSAGTFTFGSLAEGFYKVVVAVPASGYTDSDPDFWVIETRGNGDVETRSFKLDSTAP